MRRWGLRALSFLLFSLLAPFGGAPALGAELSFEERVVAQRAIEQVYYEHRIGARRPFDEAVPREVLEEKVRRYLKQSVALDQLWNAPVTAEDLRRELERIASSTKFPERLDEIYAALDHDSVLIQECFARPALVDRLARSRFSREGRARGETDAASRPSRDSRRDPARESESRAAVSWDAWWSENEARFDEGRARAVALPMERGAPSPDGPGVDPAAMAAMGVAGSPDLDSLSLTAAGVPPCLPDDTWDPGVLDDPPVARSGHTAVWTGNLMIVWGGRNHDYLDSGWRYDPLTDSWTPTSLAGAPTPRYIHTAVWTGSEMLVWGGYGFATAYVDTGGRYDPATDTWTALPTVDAPDPRGGHVAVWTGQDMIVWGGFIRAGGILSTFETGGRYDPGTDSWTATTITSAPPAGVYMSAIWSGTEMIVWGGQDEVTYSSTSFDTGGRYDPASDLWTPTSLSGAPTPRSRHSAVWTGTEMIIWGGDGASSSGTLGTGARYSPVTDSWSPVSTLNDPQARFYHSAVWTGSEMLVWGGRDRGGNEKDTGGRYDPVTDAWTPTSTAGSPGARTDQTMVWTGTEAIVWGGTLDGRYLSSGGRYDPATDGWTITPGFPDPPSPRSSHTAVWTGNEMLVWGGTDFPSRPFGSLATGSKYDPLLDAWTPISTANAPVARTDHLAVWAGDVMVIWGGVEDDRFPETAYNTGGRYDPITDTWSPTSVAGAPAGRIYASAVWTGSEMIVWGGSQDDYTAFNDGGRYDPASDAWTPISTVGAPQARVYHTAVWTGSEMIIWGGLSAPYGSNSYIAQGGRYDPATDTWTPVTTAQMPDGRIFHTAVWTGSDMIVWGGETAAASHVNTGGRYNPSNDHWMSTRVSTAPSARTSHTAVWTGNEMVVWGGLCSSGTDCSSGYISGGGRYNPVGDKWTAMSTVNEPLGRSAHTAVWTGSYMIVWGGRLLGSGSRYALNHASDDDGDGFSECDGDCNDAAASAAPGAAEICDGLDNDCDGSVDEGFDLDGDKWRTCAGDCDDSSPVTHPGAPEICDHVDNDCDGMVPAAESDADMDGVATCEGDCDDGDPLAILLPWAVSSLDVQEIPGGWQIRWEDEAVSAGAGTVYDVYTGSGQTLQSSGGDYSDGSCLAEDVAGALFDYLGPDPPPGDALILVFRGQNGCGAGTYGNPARDAQAAASPAACQ